MKINGHKTLAATDELYMKDEAVDSIRQVRHAISVEFDHDPEKLVSYYLNYQEKYSDRLAVPSRRLSRDDSDEIPIAANKAEKEFLSTADYVLNKNNELYKRLSCLQ
uniref:hypothetical protein n=1 Tax=Candidatus Electronema sp. TaxID=2698783 RepID=UPI0040569BE6